MLKKLRTRLLWGGILALILSVVTAAVSLAAVPQNEIGTPDDCLECHEDTVVSWEESKHGNALSDSLFQQAWREQGEPRECLSCHTTGFDAATGTWEAEGVTCNACHYLGPNSPSHPEQIMFTKDSADSCGACHLETFSEWQDSAHGENEMTCVNCHSAHADGIKKDNLETLCQTCHTNEGYFYGMTSHGQSELGCTDCHLRVSETPMGDGHGQRHHSFAVDLDTCNECHAEEMHFPAGNVDDDGLGVSGPAPTEGHASLLTDSQITGLSTTPASPFNFALLAGVIGLAFGFVGSPLFERWFRQSS